MIPLKLQLKNFLSYGAETQTIDFTPFNLICLSGKNGHGKSALLDAMCWAIWGEARKVSVAAKPDQGLLRLGQRHMKVVFDFTFNQQHYRIRREFTFAYNKPYALLEFGTVNSLTGEFVALTDKTIKTTQAKITATLGLSYDAFVNSAFLRQGQSHEFSKKSPSERKQVLSEMLGLDQYEQLRKLALEKIKLAEADKQVGLKLQQHWTAELQQLPTVVATVQQTQTALTALEVELQAALATKTRLDQELNQRQHLALQHAQQLQQLQALRQQWRATHRVHLQITRSGLALDQLQPRYQALRAQAEQLQAQQQQALALRAELLALQLEQQTACAAQQLQVSQLSQQLDYQKQQAQQLELAERELNQTMQQQQQEFSALQQRASQLAVASVKELQAYTAQFELRKEYYQQLVAQGNFCQAHLVQLRTRLQQWSLKPLGVCQTCEQPLAPAQQQQLQTKSLLQQQNLQRVLQLTKHRLQQLKTVLVAQHAAWQAQVQERETAGQMQLQLTSLTTQLAALQQQQVRQQVQLLQAQQAVATLETALAQQQTQLQQLAQSYHQQVATRTAALANYAPLAAQQAQNAQALAAVEQLLQQAQAYPQEQQLQQQRLQAVRELVQTSKRDQRQIGDLPALVAQQRALAQQLETLQARQLALVQQLGAAENQQVKLQQLQNQATAQEAQLKGLEQTISDYREIAVALGKEGIQALLLEEALPEIEQAANQLLGRLTDHQMQLTIESLRDLKKGGAKETLEIKIMDGVGMRPYEMFSGGEAFRIDFALRIAISQLLAHRAGTSLQTLIIDEGFGSQDEEGLGYIMDAIHKIQGDFAKVIIVSHLAAIKNQFPVHFIVEKGATGSQITVLEQG